MLKLAIFGLFITSIYSYIISVAGKGTIFVTPDIATISITVTAIDNTSQLAQADVNAKVNTIISILAAQSIPNSDIQTTSLYIYPQYNYTSNGSVLIGQQATQSISVIVRNLAANGIRLSQVIDALVVVNGIQLSGVTFGISNQSNANKQARTAAWNDALAKVQQIAQLSGLVLGKAQKIVDNPTPVNTNNIYIYTPQVPSISPNTIQEGVIQVSVTVLVDFDVY